MRLGDARRRRCERRAGLVDDGGGVEPGPSNSVLPRRRLCEDIAEATGCSVLNLDYRLTPEHPFPAAVDDAVVAVGDGMSWVGSRDR